MRFSKPALGLCLVLSPLTAWADPESELRDAASALSRTSFRWETTTRQRFSGETTEPRLNPNAPLEVQGSFDPAGYIQITLQPSRELAAPVATVFREGDVVAHTPLGWLRRSDLRQAPVPDREVDFAGKKVRLSRFFPVALKVTAARPVTEDLFDLIEDVKSVRSESGLLIAELRDRTVEKLWGDERAKSAPEIQGTVIFKITPQGLTEYHTVLAIGFPNSRTNKVAWSMQQWSTRFTGIGSTPDQPPPAALKVLSD